MRPVRDMLERLVDLAERHVVAHASATERELELRERVADAQERMAAAAEREATAAERQAGIATASKAKARKSKPRRVPTDAPIDDVTKARARKALKNSGYRVDE